MILSTLREFPEDFALMQILCRKILSTFHFFLDLGAILDTLYTPVKDYFLVLFFLMNMSRNKEKCIFPCG